MADVFDCVWNDWCCRVCLGILYVYIIRTVRETRRECGWLDAGWYL